MSRGRTLVQHDRRLGVRFVVGADEAGRGCLAGPLVTGGVLLDLERIGPREVRALGALDDSKRHGPEERERLLGVVQRLAVRTVVVSRCVEGLDERGLHVTNLEALSTAARRVAVPGALCLIDGFRVPEIGHPQRAIVGGDARSAAIAAASIVAKVTRDRFMRRAAERHPHWGFDVHMGYATAAHRSAIGEHGITPLHRRSFRSVAYAAAGLGPFVDDRRPDDAGAVDPRAAGPQAGDVLAADSRTGGPLGDDSHAAGDAGRVAAD
ncbi:ribonuclease HII [Patulibacter brassicae]|uniref:Ribonuclease n=1 Tax=Patulibacter brassicae TaxID=1705717 RepID=A0ABU4VFF3_9ACTN|nr:ribonuclease HII [Patulibacter brassicae]MDX8150434.1 ribonuclease HII [Patulibacter brassicae]